MTGRRSHGRLSALNGVVHQGSEWLAAVRWIQTVAVSEAYTMPRIFANQNVVCRLRDAATLAFLAEKLGPAAL